MQAIRTTTRENEVRERIPVPHDNYFQSFFSSRHAARVTHFLAFSNSLLQRKSTTTSKIFKMSEAQDSSCQFVINLYTESRLVSLSFLSPSYLPFTFNLPKINLQLNTIKY